MMHVGDTMSTVGVFSTVGGYRPLYIEYRGGYHDTCGGYHEDLGGVQYRVGTQITNDFPPTVLMISPTCIMISPTVLSIPHGTQDNPSRYS